MVQLVSLCLDKIAEVAVYQILRALELLACVVLGLYVKEEAEAQLISLIQEKFTPLLHQICSSPSTIDIAVQMGAIIIRNRTSRYTSKIELHTEEYQDLLLDWFVPTLRDTAFRNEGTKINTSFDGIWGLSAQQVLDCL